MRLLAATACVASAWSFVALDDRVSAWGALLAASCGVFAWTFATLGRVGS